MSLTPPDQADVDHSIWFTEQVQPHESALKNWLRFRFPWLLEVNDIAQESFLRLWRHRARAESDPIRSPKAALYTIARNLAIDEARHRAVVQIESVAEIESLSVLDSADVIRTVIAREELQILVAAMRQLPERCRQVVTLTKMYGLTERETAQRLGIAESSVRTQVIRGMERCTAYMLEHGVKRKRHESK